MRKQLRDCDPDRWEALGEFLIRQRIRLKREYASRKAFTQAKNLNYRTICDIENAVRQDFSIPMIILIERGYGLRDGFIRRFLTSESDDEPERAAA